MTDKNTKTYYTHGRGSHVPGPDDHYHYATEEAARHDNPNADRFYKVTYTLEECNQPLEVTAVAPGPGGLYVSFNDGKCYSRYDSGGWISQKVCKEREPVFQRFVGKYGLKS